MGNAIARLVQFELMLNPDCNLKMNITKAVLIKICFVTVDGGGFTQFANSFNLDLTEAK